MIGYSILSIILLIIIFAIYSFAKLKNTTALLVIALKQNKTYLIDKNSLYICCLKCGRVSYNKNDIDKKFCSNCNKYHSDIIKELLET